MLGGAVSFGLTVPAAGDGVSYQGSLGVQALSQPRCVVTGGQELGAGEHEVAFAGPFGGGAEAVAEFEFGLEEVGLQPGHRIGAEAVLEQGVRRAGPARVTSGPGWRSRASWYCCLTVGSDRQA